MFEIKIEWNLFGVKPTKIKAKTIHLEKGSLQYTDPKDKNIIPIVRVAHLVEGCIVIIKPK